MTKKTYYYAIGRRKTSSAVIRLFPEWKGNMDVQKWEKKVSLKQYFGWHKYLLEDALYPFYILWDNALSRFDAEIVVKGWGLKWQAEAIRLWFSRALIELNNTYKSQLKPFGLLKRDPRAKERKKFGLKKARRAPQWSKR